MGKLADQILQMQQAPEESEPIPATLPPDSQMSPEMRDLLLESGGSIVGGTLGAGFGSLGGPFTAGALGMLGAGAGAVATIPFQSRRPTFEEAFGRGATGEALGMGFGPLLGAAARSAPAARLMERMAQVPGLRRLIAPLIEKLEPGGRETMELLAERGVTPTPGQVSRSTYLDMMENMAEASFGGKPIIRGTRERAVTAVDNMVEEFVTGFQMQGDKVATGQFLQDALENRAAAHARLGRFLFKHLDNSIRATGAPAEVVDLRAAQAAAHEIIGRAKAGVTSQRTRELQIAKDILRKDPVVSFKDAQELRSDLLQMVRTGEEAIPGKRVGATQHLANQVDGAMEKAAKGLGPGVLEEWRGANQFWKDGKELFNSKIIDKMINEASPELLVQGAIKPGRVSDIRRLKKALGRNPARMDAVKGVYATELVKAASPAGELSGKAFAKKLHTVGDDVLDELYGPGGAKRLKDLARARELTEGSAKGPQTASFAIVLAQVGAASALLGAAIPSEVIGIQIPGGRAERGLTAGVLGTSTAVLLGPRAVAKVFSDPIATQWLTTGLRAVPGSKAASRAAGQLLTRFGELGVLEMDQRLRQGLAETIEPTQSPQEALRSRAQQVIDRNRLQREQVKRKLGVASQP